MLSRIANFFSSKKNDKILSEEVNLLGNLYHKKIGHEKETVSLEVNLTLHSVQEDKFDYELIARNQDNIDEWKIKKFKITNERSFKLLYEKKNYNILWSADDGFYIFTIYNEECNKKNFNQFIETLLYLITSYEYEIHVSQVNWSDAKEYLFDTEIDNIEKFLEDNYEKYEAPELIKKKEENSDENQEEEININEISENLDKVMHLKKFCFKKTYPQAEELFRAEGTLYKFFLGEEKLKDLSSKTILYLYGLQNYRYFISVEEIGKQETYTHSLISQETNLTANNEDLSIIFLSKDSNVKNAYVYSFNEKKNFTKFKKLIAKIQYESNNHQNFEDLDDDNKEWLEKFNENDLDASQNSVMDVEMELETEFSESDTGGKNKATAQSYCLDRTFILREDQIISVYKSDKNNNLEHIVDLPAFEKYNNKEINISSIKLFGSEKSMLLQDTLHPSSLYKFDLTKGKIVEEWDCGDMNIVDFCPDEKYGQMSESPIINAFDSNSLFCIDSRVDNPNRIVLNKNYKTKTRFSCIAVTGFGGIAVGSLSGEIRLYKEMGKNAKTLIPSLGDPINAIDVTFDGKYILATCDKYLIVICTICKGKSNGFDIQMGAEKPYPKILKINPIDVKIYGLEKYNFTKARFNVTNNDQETNIVTSLGDYLINWNFTKIRKGILDDYKIKKAHQNIFDNNYKFNCNEILVTMEHKLRLQKQNIK